MEVKEQTFAKDATAIEKKTYNKLISGSLKVDSLFIENDAHKKAFLRYIRNYASTGIKQLRTENEKRFLKLALLDDYKYFLNLDRDQYSEDLAQIFVSQVLKLGQHENLSIKNTYDNRVLLITNYSTHEGTNINYFDSKLELYVLLNIAATVQFKIVSCLKFLQVMDADIAEFGVNYVYDRIQFAIKESLEYAVLKTLSSNGDNYYELMANKDQVEKRFAEKFYTHIGKDVVELSQLNIENIGFTKDILEKLEEIGFANKIKREELSNEIRYEKESLDLYERKVKIHEANPKVAWNLSEAEKDKALDRYMIKTGLREKAETEIVLKKKENKIATHNVDDGKIEANKNIISNLSKKPFIPALILIFLNLLGGLFGIIFSSDPYEEGLLVISIILLTIAIILTIVKRRSVFQSHRGFRVINVIVELFMMTSMLINIINVGSEEALVPMVIIFLELILNICFFGGNYLKELVNTRIDK